MNLNKLPGMNWRVMSKMFDVDVYSVSQVSISFKTNADVRYRALILDGIIQAAWLSVELPEAFGLLIEADWAIEQWYWYERKHGMCSWGDGWVRWDITPLERYLAFIGETLEVPSGHQNPEPIWELYTECLVRWAKGFLASQGLPVLEAKRWNIQVVSCWTVKPTVYIGSAHSGWHCSVLAGPSTIRSEKPEEMIAEYRRWLWAQMQEETPARAAIMELVTRFNAGERISLGCWCAPRACHGDVIKRAIEHYARLAKA
jgi:hypothetical protein